MDIRKLKKLFDLINENNIAEIEIREEKESVHIVLDRINKLSNLIPNTLESASQIQRVEQKSPTELVGQDIDIKDKHTINSPMVGTVYLSPAPGAKPFVEVGQKIKTGDTLCLIEAMKMFNRISSDRDGVITKKLVENSQPVEYNQPLFIVE
jgi:acetyl-CoA carboxylase biotin carboxyl carrier protein